MLADKKEILGWNEITKINILTVLARSSLITLADPVYHPFCHPWVIYPSSHFDIQCLVMFFPFNWIVLTIRTTFYCFSLFPEIFPSSYLHYSLSTEFHEFIPRKKMTKNNFILSFPAAFGWSLLLPLPPSFLSPSYRCFLAPLTPMSCAISSSPPVLLLFPPLLFSFDSHSWVLFSSHNKGMFFSSHFKPILDLICPSNCCFLSLSSVNSLNMPFLVPRVPLLIGTRTYFLLKPYRTTALSEGLYDFQGTNRNQCVPQVP